MHYGQAWNNLAINHKLIRLRYGLIIWAIVHKLNEMLKETQRLEALYQRKIELLDELKKSLLQQAVAGEL